MSLQPASIADIELVHTPAYVETILKTASKDLTVLALDTPVSSQSYISAWLAAGGCVKAVQALLSGRCDACFCLCRPPGHQALPGKAGGHCIFNNIGIAAKYAIERHGLKRILIIDWDIHHGIGLQNLFFEHREVFYLSTHHTGWHPYSGHLEETGRGEGLGYTVNIPVPKDIEDSDLVYLYRRLLEPIIDAYNPQAIFVAAGFDAHRRDPVGRTLVTENAFRLLTELIIEFRGAVRSPPLLFALEGGYDFSALASCVREVLTALTYKGRRESVSVSISRKGADFFEQACRVHGRLGVWTD